MVALFRKLDMFLRYILTLFALISSFEAHELLDVMINKTMVDLTNTVRASTMCSCRDFCSQDEVCFAYTWIARFEGNGKCYTSTNVSITFIDAIGHTSVSGLKIKPLHEDVIANAIQGSDGLYYWIPTTDQKSFSDAESLCEGRLHRFQLGIYKTSEQYDALVTIVEDENLGETWVNLHYDSDMNVHWSDGTLYSEADTGAEIKTGGTSDEKFRLRSNSYFDDKSSTDLFSVLCQYKPNI